MDITWYGHSCFRITERTQTTIITDPYSPEIGLPELKLKGDLVTVSQSDSIAYNATEFVKNTEYILEGPGEYEFGGTFIWGIPMHTVTDDHVKPNVAYQLQYSNGLSVLHLGELNQMPDQSTIQDLGEINVLLIPVGGNGSLKAGLASEVVALIEPNFVVPMQYALPGLQVELDPVENFLKAMGVSNAQEEETLKVSSSQLPEQPQVVVLQPKFSD